MDLLNPRDGETAWFVPALDGECRVAVEGRVVVTRMRDGGKSFDVLTEGLPQCHAYDLVYRHALDVDPRAIDSPSVRRQVRSGSPKIEATPGTASPTTSRRSTPFALRREGTTWRLDSFEPSDPEDVQYALRNQLSRSL